MLRRTVAQAEAGDYLVDDQQGTIRASDLAQATEKTWLGQNHAHVCRHWFDNNGGDLIFVLDEQALDGSEVVVGSIQGELRESLGNARTFGNAQGGQT